MTEAWMKREVEQQKFLQELERGARDFADEAETGDGLFLLLACEIVKDFIAKRGGILLPKANPEQILAWERCSEFLRKIEDFSRTEGERHVLEKRFLEKLLIAGLGWVESEYLRERVHEPEKLYEGHRAMDEVPLDSK